MPLHQLHVSKSLVEELGLDWPPYKVQRVRSRRTERRNAMILANSIHSLPEDCFDRLGFKKRSDQLTDIVVSNNMNQEGGTFNMIHRKEPQQLEEESSSPPSSSPPSSMSSSMSSSRSSSSSMSSITTQTTKKRLSFSFKLRAEKGEPSLLSSIQAIAKMNLVDDEEDVEDNVETENDLNQIAEGEETILEESMRLFWTSNNRIKEERQRRRSMLEVKSRGKRDSFSLPSQIQNLPKLLNLGGNTFDSDDSEDNDEQEILKLYETIQSNNIHNCRRHSYYE